MPKPPDGATALTMLVVPCFNEAERLDQQSFTEFLQANDGFRLLFVNDGSSDDTVDVLRRIQASGPANRIEILDLQRNQGKAEAVRQGMLHVLEQFSYENPVPDRFIGYFDADLATPIDEIPRLVDVAIRRRDVAVIVGARMQLQGRKIERARMRRWCGAGFAWLADFLLGLRIRDTQCGVKIFRVQNGLRELFVNPFMSRWLFDVELLSRLQRSARMDCSGDRPESSATSFEIFEYPLEQWRDVAGSKLRFGVFALAPLELLHIALVYRLGIRSTRRFASDGDVGHAGAGPAVVNREVVSIPFSASDRKAA